MTVARGQCATTFSIFFSRRRYVANNFDAEQGMAGGAAVSVITKSGTNTFHGVAFEYTANHKWGAKNLFFNPNTPAGPGTPQRTNNQFGGTLGGPIRKDTAC